MGQNVKMIVLLVIIILIVTFFVSILNKKIAALLSKYYRVELDFFVKKVLLFNVKGYYILFKIFPLIIMLLIIVILDIKITIPVILFCSFLSGIWIFAVIRISKNAVKQLIDFSRYSSSLEFYKTLSISERKEVYKSFMEYLKYWDLSEIKDVEIRDVLKSGIMEDIDQVLSFHYVDNLLNSSSSKIFTGSLVCINFKSSVLELVELIDIQFKSRGYSNLVSFEVGEMVSKIGLLKFDDSKGLHYDRSLVLGELGKALNKLENIDVKLKELDMKSVVTYGNTSSTYDNYSIEEKEESIKNDSNFKVIKFTNTELKQSTLQAEIIHLLGKNHQIFLNKSQRQDLNFFINRRFKNFKSKQGSVSITDYNDKTFWIDNMKEFCECLGIICNKFSLSKKELAIILSEEYHESLKSYKTFQNML